MSGLSVLLLVLTVVGGSWCSVIRAPEARSFEEHMGEVLKFKCSVPQLRSFRSRELIHDLASTEFVSPEMTVLHWCDAGSGCCLGSETSSCAMKEYEEVELPFVIRDHFEGSQREVVVRVNNHTKCACKNSFEDNSLF